MITVYRSLRLTLRDPYSGAEAITRNLSSTLSLNRERERERERPYVANLQIATQANYTATPLHTALHTTLMPSPQNPSHDPSPRASPT